MTPKLFSALVGLQRQIENMDIYLRRQRRKFDNLFAQFESAFPRSNKDFTNDEISNLLRLNQRLGELELYLCNMAKTENEKLQARVTDPNNPVDDYEIDATLYFVLREDDPEFDDSDDNFLTQRDFSLKGLSRGCIGDGQDYREIVPYFPAELNETAQCWLFHDLYDHSYGLQQPDLSLHDCLRVGSIWVDVAIRHQSTLNIKSGDWQSPLAFGDESS